ncbi:STAS domain-containing protein [Pseudooceanicola sp.]|uniref:STAS domain-containing protein n=1 Tax=Pseudooceanicola sp. TaxID=1914328 RepID=UPI002602ED18|nr:STAS domain-containing protein [Pseudooceanicola sp.]MDF1854586.1 STAS domain-containing protein [Pseudooceanicola sp.]
MDLKATQNGRALVITADAARIDAAVAIRFKDLMREVIPADAGRVILDLGQVGFIDSSGLGAIVSVMKQLGADQTLELAALHPTVDRVFRLTRMDSVFPIHADLTQALRDHAG